MHRQTSLPPLLESLSLVRIVRSWKCRAVLYLALIVDQQMMFLHNMRVVVEQEEEEVVVLDFHTCLWWEVA
uniref:Uncharacterized protein n=1 Tax=Helianthus annuus TaxID=4232 RepID=A0A251S1D4_HELAN